MNEIDETIILYAASFTLVIGAAIVIGAIAFLLVLMAKAFGWYTIAILGTLGAATHFIASKIR
jgi:hypothetical protein